MNATIEERGNGLPNVGEFVYHASSNTVYKIVSLGSNISTHGGGRGNSIEAELEFVGDPFDIPESDFDEIGEYGVNIDE